MVKNVPANAENGRDQALIPGLGRSPGVGNSNPLQLSLPGNAVDRGIGGVQSMVLKKRWR